MIKKGKRLLFAHNAAFILFCIMGLGFFMAGISPTSFSFAGGISSIAVVVVIDFFCILLLCSRKEKK